MKMLEKYRMLYRVYLRSCKSLYDPSHPYDGLEDCIRMCESNKCWLFGMLDLMQEMDEITEETYDAESERIIRDFSSIAICNAYKADGVIYTVYSGEGEK